MNELLQHAIAGMASADSEARVLSANEIYRTGRAQAEHAVFPWWSEEKLAELLESHNPKVTVGLAVTPERFQQIHEASGLPRLAEVPPDASVVAPPRALAHLAERAEPVAPGFERGPIDVVLADDDLR